MSCRFQHPRSLEGKSRKAIHLTNYTILDFFSPFYFFLFCLILLIPRYFQLNFKRFRQKDPKKLQYALTAMQSQRFVDRPVKISLVPFPAFPSAFPFLCPFSFETFPELQFHKELHTKNGSEIYM